MSGSRLAEAPAWLIEKVERRDDGGRRRSDGRRVRRRDDVGGGPIAEGRRNVTLASIAGGLRAQGRNREELEDELLAINAERCSPPLPDEEIRRIAASIARYAAGDASPGPDAETLAALAEIEDAVWRREWKGLAGKSQRDLLIALIKAAGLHGTLIPAGVRISISIRALALAAALSKRATEKGIKGLRKSGVLRRDGTGSGTQAGAFVLLRSAKVGHSTTGGVSKEKVRRSSVLPLRAPRLRWSAPDIRRLGKTAGAVIDALEKLGGRATVEELAAILEVKRPRELTRRRDPALGGAGRDGAVTRLEAAGVVECSGDTVTLVADWLEALNREREGAGEIAAYRRDVERYNREREGYRKRHENKPDPAPTQPEMDAARRERALLTAEEAEVADAILAYEERYGGGSFRWDWASCKKLFYKTGHWPDVRSLKRLRDYLGVPREAA